MKNHIVHNVVHCTVLLAFVLLMGSCATKDSATNKEDERLHVAKENALKRIEELKEKYGMGDSVLVFKSIEEQEEYNKRREKWMEELSKPDTVYNEDGSIKSITSGSVTSEIVKNPNPESIVSISPNPTSSSVTLTFYAGYQTEIRDKIFPSNITVDLYYLDQKVHTFTFPNSYGTETISEQYLQKDGSYRVVYQAMSVPFMVRKN